MTREGDAFVRLRDRIAVARDADADIFLSLHADSIANRTVRGGSVYTLSEKASDAEAAALAAKENKADLIAGIDLNDQSREVVNILIDLAQRKTMNESVTFAKHLVQELGRSTRLLPRTHRFAGFAVLKAPDVPSALIELGYLSNRQDERMLNEARERSRISIAILRAVDTYFAKQHAQAKP
jgi:N-acetylmuramoyl-L-alanine amidase